MVRKLVFLYTGVYTSVDRRKVKQLGVGANESDATQLPGCARSHREMLIKRLSYIRAA